MCSTTMKEMSSGHVFLNDISPSVLVALLTYLYTDTFDLRYPDVIMDLLVTARKVRTHWNCNYIGVVVRSGFC